MMSAKYIPQLRVVDIGCTPKEFARVMVCQPSWQLSDWDEKNHLYAFKEERTPRIIVESFLRKAQEHSCDLLVLPELSVPESLENTVVAWSKQTKCMVVCGSHYFDDKDGTISRSPISHLGEVHYAEKMHPAPAEISPISGKGLKAGRGPIILTNTPVGSLAVLICSDYLKDTVKQAVLSHKIDVMCVVSFQKDSNRYHQRIDIDVEEFDGGLYVLYANNCLDGQGDGRSAAFAITENMYKGRLVSDGHTDNAFPSKLCQLRANEDYFIADIDLLHKRPLVRKNVNSRPNFLIVARGACCSAGGSPKGEVSHEGREVTHEEASQKIIGMLKKLIATHGFDDKNWIKAFSSMYFLSKIARQLNMTASDDYENLLDNFLTFFNFRANGGIYLRKDQILVTPDENEKIRKHMDEEDASDPYFSASAKTRSDNIDMDLMHQNYLYGVALGISAREESEIMRAVRESALKFLIYSQNPSTRYVHGGWIPYRVPWITARILISLSELDIGARQDGGHLAKLIHDALESLILRLHAEGYWRSGVGSWVSKWECTALCLEAFLCLDKERRYASVFDALMPRIVSHKDDWMKGIPDFSDEERSNETLATVLMSSAVIRLQKSYPTLSQSIGTTLMSECYRYLLAALEGVSGASAGEQRQFCTIPQVAAYCGAAVLS